VLYLHGSPGGYDHAAFTHPSFSTLSVSRPGYLKTPLEVGRTPREQADAVASLLDTLGVDPVTVMAASGGGPCALALAHAHPERVIRVVLVEPVSHALALPPVPALMRSDLGVALFSSLARPAALARALVSGEENQRLALRSPESRAHLTRLVRGTWPPSRRMAGWENDAAQFLDLEPPAPTDIPCLIVHGTRDQNVPFTHSERLAALLPHARLHAVEGADHFMPVTHTDELRGVILDFLGVEPS
jgi:pimeloyl-ACP methyl ester carboxylesterase